MSTFPWLTVTIFLPLVGAVVIFLLDDARAKVAALAVSLADLVLSLPLWTLFDSGVPGMQFAEQAAWITSPAINYSLGLDGISLPLYLMTTFLVPLCVLASWQSVTVRVRGFMATLLIMETAMLGVFAAL